MPDITCPFCGLLCDDLRIAVANGRARIEAGGCPRSERLFDAPSDGQARVGGQVVDADAACRAAARILAAARRPLIGGLACDVTGQRAAIALAEQVGGVLDHMNGRAQFRNILAFQDGGWMTTTLSEVRNRADLVLLAGTDAAAFPRFFERLLAGESQFGEPRRRLIALLPALPSPPLSAKAELAVPPAQEKRPSRPPWGPSRCWDGPANNLSGVDLAIPCPRERLGELFAALRARLAGKRLDAADVAGVPIAQLDELLDALRAARYGVLVWNAAELDFPQADLTVQAMVDLVKDLNRDTRWSGLPLGGNDGDTCAAQVCTWQTGYPLRTAYTAGGPHYDPLRYGTDSLLASGEVDALVWISAFDPERKPPACAQPAIVLGRADMAFATPPDVFIPVAVPGVQQIGFLHRMDGVVALPLAAPVASGLPGVAQVLAMIRKELNHAAA